MSYSFEQFFKDKKSSDDSRVREASFKFWNAYNQIKKKIEHNVVVIHNYFPQYSLYNRKHSEVMISQIEHMLGEEHWNTITVADVWMFLCCAYIYDIGRLIFDNEWRTDWESKEFQRFLKECRNHLDGSIKNAAEHMILERPKLEKSPLIWPITTQRDNIILRTEFYYRKHINKIEKIVESKLKPFLNDSLSLEERVIIQIQKQMAKIFSMQGVNFECMLEQLPFEDSLLETNYHPRLVAVLLRLGDLCNFDNTRFDIRWLQENGGLTDTNLIHYYKHQSVVSNNISSEEINIILDFNLDSIKKQIAGEEEIDGIEKIKQTQRKEDRASQHDFCNQIIVETNHWFKWLEDELKKTKYNWKQIGGSHIPLLYPILHKKIKIDNEEAILEDKHIQFIFPSQKAYTFIENNHLYDDQLIFIREFIQNSLDALKLKFWHQLREGIYDRQIYKECLSNITNEEGEIDYAKLQPFDFIDYDIYEDYEVRIIIEHQDGEKTAKFIIEDNGIGISIDDINAKIVETSTSWNREGSNEDLNGIPVWLYPTGRFGIGIHTAFSLVDRIYIQTKPENNRKSYEITLHPGKKDGYVFVSACNETLSFCRKKGSGTRIEIIIDIEKYKNQNEKYEDNPFIEHPKSKMCFAIEHKIKSVCGTPLFKIKYRYQKITKDIPSFSKSEKFRLLFQKEKRNILFDNSYDKSEETYDFAFEECGKVMIIWDRKQAIALRFTFYDIRKTICCYKGILIQNANIQNVLSWLNLEYIDILGKKCEEILTITRDNIKWEYQEKLKEILWKCNKWIAGVYKELLLNLYYNESIQKRISELEKNIENQIQQYKEIYKEISAYEFPNDSVNKVENTFINTIGNDNIDDSRKKWKDNLRLLYYIPFHQIIWLILALRDNSEIRELHELIEDKRIFMKPDFNNGYGFIYKNNMSQILNAKTLEIPYTMFEYAQKKLPYLKYIPCNYMIYRKKEVLLSFDMENKSKRAIKIMDIFLLKECIKNGTLILPAFLAYKESAVDKVNIESCILTSNYYLILWNRIDKMKEYSIHTKQEKEKVIENLMNEEGEDGKRVKNIIEYIYRNKAYKVEKETYNETIKRIRTSYRKFIADVLDCIRLSDEELKKIEPGMYVI